MSQRSEDDHPMEKEERSPGAIRNSRTARLAKILIPIALVVLGLALVIVLVATRRAPTTEPRTERVVPVEVVIAQLEGARALVETKGQVQPAQSIELEVEVAGRVTWLSPELMPGGRLRRGANVLRVDASDYELSAIAQRGEVSQAEVQLRQERNRQEVSERAWERYRARRQVPEDADPALALNLPQVAAAERALESARSRLRQAELDLSRTTVSAPFNASVIREQVDVGQRVAPGQAVATLVGTDRYWVNVSVDVDDLHLIRIPQAGRVEEGSHAVVSFASRTGRTEREGRVLRLVKELGAESSMARVIVQVDDPLGLERDVRTDEPRGPPLLVGAFVDVHIEGELLEDVFVLPAEVLRQDDRVWVVGDEDRLEERRVEVVRHQRGVIIVSEGLKPGDRIVRSHLPLAIPGMRVQPQERRAETDPHPRPRRRGPSRP